MNPFALLFLLPSLHAWLWLPQLRTAPLVAARARLRGRLHRPVLLLWSFAFRFGLGLDTPWYLAELAAIGYVPFVAVVVALAWLAVAAQLLALATGRYAPYPRPPSGRRAGRSGAVRTVVARRPRRAARPMTDKAYGRLRQARVRITGTVLIVAGVLALGWAAARLAVAGPVHGALHALPAAPPGGELRSTVRDYRVPSVPVGGRKVDLAGRGARRSRSEARRYRAHLQRGQAVGR